MNLLDVFLFLILIGFIYKGSKQGITYMIGQALGIIIGTLIASRLFDDFGKLLQPLFLGNYEIAALASFVVLFQVINEFLGYLLKHFQVLSFLEQLPIIYNFESIDKWTGAALGLFVGNLVIGVILYFLSRFSLSPSFTELLNTSRLALPFIEFSKWFTELFPPEFKDLPSIIQK